MKAGASTGVHFGLSSGVITTLGLMVGLHSGTHSTSVVVGGIITIAIADSLSDALGIHVAKEAEHHRPSVIWRATLLTLITKTLMAATFLLPVLLLELQLAIVVSIVWGLLVITLLSYRLAVSRGDNPLKAIAEHLAIACVVIMLTHWVGDWVAAVFSQSA